MKKILVFDPDAETLADQIARLRPLWQIAPASDAHDLLQMTNNFRTQFDLVILSFGRHGTAFDPLLLLLLLRLNTSFSHSKFLVLLPWKHNNADNIAAIAGGADDVELYPTNSKHLTFLVYKVMLRLLYPTFTRPETDAQLTDYRNNVSGLPSLN